MAFKGDARVLDSQPEVELVQTRCTAGTRLDRHQHEHAFLSILFRGEYREGHGRNWHACRPNTLTWHPPGDSHEVEHGPADVESLQIEFPAKEFAGMPLKGLLPEQRFSIRNPRTGLIGASLLEECREGDDLAKLASRGLIMQLLSMAGRHNRQADGRPDRRLAAAVRVAIEETSPGTPDIVMLAESLGETPESLESRFRRVAGHGIATEVRRQRVAHACDLLAEPGLSLAQVSLDCGFYDQSHFNRIFRKFMHCTPGFYRNQMPAWRR